ncbi:MAG: hypothetical protein WD770_00100 [Actinomycetota bacterium]
MDAVIWAALGILTAATFGNLYYLGSKIAGLGTRIDALDTKLSGRIDSLDTKLSGRIDSLDARLTARIDHLADRLGAHVAPHAG